MQTDRQLRAKNPTRMDQAASICSTRTVPRTNTYVCAQLSGAVQDRRRKSPRRRFEIPVVGVQNGEASSRSWPMQNVTPSPCKKEAQTDCRRRRERRLGLRHATSGHAVPMEEPIARRTEPDVRGAAPRDPPASRPSTPLARAQVPTRHRPSGGNKRSLLPRRPCSRRARDSRSGRCPVCHSIGDRGTSWNAGAWR